MYRSVKIFVVALQDHVAVDDVETNKQASDNCRLIIQHQRTHIVELTVPRQVLHTYIYTLALCTI